MKKDRLNNNIAEQVTKLPSVQNEALSEIVQGLYQGKPLLGPGGLLTNLVKELTQIALQGEMDSHLQPKLLVRIKIEKRTSMRVTGVSIPSVGHYNLINF